MNVQNASLVDAKAEPYRSGLTPGYMSGFGNSFETEALRRRAAGRAQFAAAGATTGSMPSSLSGSPFTAPQSDQSALLALPHPADA